MGGMAHNGGLPMGRTLTLDEAARVLKTTAETVSECIRARSLPAAKIGRAWVLVEDDVIDWLRQQYSAQNTAGGALCGSTSVAKVAPGGLTSPLKACRDLTAALAPRTNPRRGSGARKLRAINGVSAGLETPQA